jgi:hypothetical protein
MAHLINAAATIAASNRSAICAMLADDPRHALRSLASIDAAKKPARN